MRTRGKVDMMACSRAPSKEGIDIYKAWLVGEDTTVKGMKGVVTGAANRGGGDDRDEGA